MNTQVGTSEVMHDADLGGQDPKNMYIVPENAMMFIIEFLSWFDQSTVLFPTSFK